MYSIIGHRSTYCCYFSDKTDEQSRANARTGEIASSARRYEPIRIQKKPHESIHADPLNRLCSFSDTRHLANTWNSPNSGERRYAAVGSIENS